MPTFAVNITNASASRDGQAATDQVEQENIRRAAEDPPGTPLPLSTNAELLASYKTVLESLLDSAHESFVLQAARRSQQEAAAAWLAATDAQRAAALAALTA